MFMCADVSVCGFQLQGGRDQDKFIGVPFLSALSLQSGNTRDLELPPAESLNSIDNQQMVRHETCHVVQICVYACLVW